MNRTIKAMVLCAAALAVSVGTMAADILTVAVLPFSERGTGVKDEGDIAAQLVFAGLAENPDIWLLERDKIDQTLKEAELNISGVVDPAQAIQIGRLTGAKVLVTGSVFKVKDKTYVVAKVISAETSRVFGKSAGGVGGVDQLAVTLGSDISGIIKKNAGDLVAKALVREDVIEALGKVLVAGSPRPVVYVNVVERHVGQPTSDPAATTELQRILKALDFKVTEDRSAADVCLLGEAFSELAGRHENLLSVNARLELKALDNKGNVLAADRQTTIVVGLAEQIAGKQALQNAADQIAGRVIPKLVAK